MLRRFNNNFIYLAKYWKTHGFSILFSRIYCRIEDLFFDLFNGTDTFIEHRDLGELGVNLKNTSHFFGYQTSNSSIVRKVIKKIDINTSESGFVDIGAGKGKVSLLAASLGFRRVYGVEISSQLCKIAASNVNKYQEGKYAKKINIVQINAVEFCISPDINVFFMYNPFNASILKKILANIKLSLESEFREITIIYYHPKYPLEKLCDFLLLNSEMEIKGREINIYNNITSKITHPDGHN